MPDQPADPLHYEMKIPPEPKNRDDSTARDESREEHRGSGQVTAESNGLQRPATSTEDVRRSVPGGPTHPE